MFFQQILLPSAIVPTLAALVVAALGLTLAKDDEEGQGVTLAGLAVALAFLAAFVTMTGLPRWLPVEASQRLFFAVLLGGVASVVAVAVAKPVVQWTLAAALWTLTLPALLETPLRHSWSTTEATLWLGGLFFAGLLIGAGFLRTADEPRPALPVRAVVRVLVLSGAALALGLSGTARMAQRAGAVAAGVFAVEAIGFARSDVRWRPAQGLVLAVAALGLLIIGHFYAELALLPFLLVVLALLLLGLPGDGWATRLAPLLPLAAALALVVVAFLEQPEDPYDYYSRSPSTADFTVARDPA
ncbi:MAG: hypothetical protein AAGK22_22855 [Acidobacteriota bacterium]